MAKVIILGGGLSAAFAWRACLDHGIVPDVITDRIFTPPGGCIWVQWLPKSIKDKSLWEEITIERVGTAEGYARKMWGRDVKTSFPAEDTKTKGVNPVKAAKALWGNKELLKPKLKQVTVDQKILDSVALAYDVVILTFPLGAAKPEWETPIWVLTKERFLTTGKNLVVYGGGNEQPFVRYSYLFGIQSFEFPPQRAEAKTHSLTAYEWAAENNLIDDPVARLWYAPEIPPEEVTGKINVDNYADGNVLYCGRWASGSRKFLSHQTYDRVVWHLRREKLAT